MPVRSLPRRHVASALLLAAALALAPAAALADDYDPKRAGHPLRVAAYVLHPVGFALDWLLFRPAHWMGSLPLVRDVFGHDTDQD